NSNGTFSFTVTSRISWGTLFAHDVTLTLTQNGMRAAVSGVLDLTTRISLPPFGSRDIGIRGTLSHSFNVNTNGTFSTSGSFTVTAYLGISHSTSIGFTLTNSELVIRTSGFC